MADEIVTPTLPELDDKQKLVFREMQLEMSRFQLQQQTLQTSVQNLTKRMNDFILKAASSVSKTEGLSFDQNTLVFSYTELQ